MNKGGGFTVLPSDLRFRGGVGKVRYVLAGRRGSIPQQTHAIALPQEESTKECLCQSLHNFSNSS